MNKYRVVLLILVVLFCSSSTATAQFGRLIFWKKQRTTLTPSGPAVDFNYKCAQTGVIACYGFDSQSATRTFPTSGEPIKYNWDTPSVCDSAGLGTNYPLSSSRLSTEANTKATVQNGSCYNPFSDQTTKHSGTGSLHISFPSLSDSAVGGYFTVPFAGLSSSPYPTYGVNALLHQGLWVQFYYRTHNMVQTFNGAVQAVNGYKQLGIFPEPPATSSSVDTWTHLVYPARNHIFEVYNHNPDGTQIEVHESNIGGTLYVQDGARCPYDPSAVYSDSRCIKNQDDTWQEITMQLTWTPQIFDGVVSGTTLTSASNPFNARDAGYSVYIYGKGSFMISTFNSASSVTLASAPGNASNLTVFISNEPNSAHSRTWINGKILDDYTFERLAWGSANPDVGYAQFLLQPHSTNKINTIAHTAGDVWYDDLIISTQPIPLGSDPTYLQTQIAAMTPPQYIALNTTPLPGLGGFNNIGTPPSGDPIANALDAADSEAAIGNGSKMEFDPVTRRMFHLGASHRGGKIFTVYDERTNDTCISSFTFNPNPPVQPVVPPAQLLYYNHCGGSGPPVDLSFLHGLSLEMGNYTTNPPSYAPSHTFETEALAPSARCYFYWFGTGDGLSNQNIACLDLDYPYNGALGWRLIPGIPSALNGTFYGGTFGALSWFPELGPNGTLVLLGGGPSGYVLFGLDWASQTWSIITQLAISSPGDSSLTGMYQLWMRYNAGTTPLNGSVLLGGGNISAPGGTGFWLAPLTSTDLASSGTGPPYTITSATGGFSSSYIGETFNITSGTHFVNGNYLITAVASGTSLTVSTNPTDGNAASGGHGSTAWSVGQAIVDTGSHIQTVSTAGVGGTGFPAFADSCVAICSGAPVTTTDGSAVWTETRNLFNRYTFRLNADASVTKLDNNPLSSGTNLYNNSTQAVDPSTHVMYQWLSQPQFNVMPPTGQIFHILNPSAGGGSQWTTGASSPAPLVYNPTEGGVYEVVCGTMWGRGTIMCFKYRGPSGPNADIIIYKAQ